MNIKALSDFLKIAKKNAYASETAEKAKPLRPSSEDYEYSDGSFLYHDTYFGGKDFIGEEIVYENNKPMWGMNYNGYIVDDYISEADVYKFLRGALKQEYEDVIPVRGPKQYRVDNFEYQNNVNGDLAKFEGREEIKKDGKLIYYAIFHGGLIK